MVEASAAATYLLAGDAGLRRVVSERLGPAAGDLSFFITARLLSQETRAAFTTVMIEQPCANDRVGHVATATR